MTMGEDGIIPVSLLEYVMIAAKSKTIWKTRARTEKARREDHSHICGRLAQNGICPRVIGMRGLRARSISLPLFSFFFVSWQRIAASFRPKERKLGLSSLFIFSLSPSIQGGAAIYGIIRPNWE